MVGKEQRMVDFYRISKLATKERFKKMMPKKKNNMAPALATTEDGFEGVEAIGRPTKRRRRSMRPSAVVGCLPIEEMTAE